MNVTMWRNDLKQGLDIAERAAAKSSSLPILQNILLRAKKGVVELSATDLQVGITYGVAAKVEEQGACVFPGRFLSALLGVFQEEQTSLRLEQNRLVVASANHKETLPAADTEEFPIIPSADAETFGEVEAGVWCAALGQVAGMAGQSQTRPEISGVLCVLERRAVKLVATDSFRLAEKTIVLEQENEAQQTFILPQRTAREIAATLAERPGKIKISASPAQVVFGWRSAEQSSQTRIEIVSRLIEGEYPRYEDVIPAGQKTKVRASRAELLSHVKAAGIFAGKTSEVRIAAAPKEKTLSFFSENTEAGSHTSTTRAEIEGEAVEAAFNWRFLADGLAQMKGDMVEMGLNGEDGPALVRPGEQEGYRYVLMPIKA